MNITLIVSGKAKSGPVSEMVDDYVKRMSWQVKIVELEDKQFQALELEDCKKWVKNSDAIYVMLDKDGKNYSSEAFAKWIETYQVQGTSHMVFLIGGPEGFPGQLRDAISQRMAFGAMTWPHMLARVMLVEQIYRSFSILKGSAYHK